MLRRIASTSSGDRVDSALSGVRAGALSAGARVPVNVTPWATTGDASSRSRSRSRFVRADATEASSCSARSFCALSAASISTASLSISTSRSSTELAEPATMFVVPGVNCRLASFDWALRSLGAGRPWAGVVTEFAGADWLLGAVCGLCVFACWFLPPFRLGAIRIEISV